MIGKIRNEGLGMRNDKKIVENLIYSLIPLEEFKSILGIDDREDKLAQFCLVTATFSIEQYCKRRFLRKKHFECLEYIGDLIIPLREYPVSQVLTIYAMSVMGGSGELVEPDFYSVIPACGTDCDYPFSLSFTPALHRYQGLSGFKAVYWAGYSSGCVPTDLASACMELAAWNMSRYRSKKIGMTGNIRGAGKEGEHFEMSMPENVRSLLEPYRRKTI
jgi:hypothetical protein